MGTLRGHQMGPLGDHLMVLYEMTSEVHWMDIRCPLEKAIRCPFRKGHLMPFRTNTLDGPCNGPSDGPSDGVIFITVLLNCFIF
jgi:hypothetical protein